MQHYDVTITQTAETDLREIISYISSQLSAPIAADNMLELFVKAIFGLERMPERHPLVEDGRLQSLGYRILPVKSYIVFYVVDPMAHIVTIERILYGRRDWLYLL